MKKIENRKSETGFIVILAVLLLLVMSLMGTTLVVIASNDHAGNLQRDYNQQTFYAAETGIQEAIRFLDEVVQVGESLVSYTHPDQDLNFCKTGLFPTISQNKSSVQAIGIDPGATKKMSSSGYGGGVNKIGRQSLNNLMTGNDAIEEKRLAKYQYEWFITQTPDYKGATNGTRRSKEVEGGSSGSGQNISESASYVQENIFSSTGTSYYFTIYSCGKGENDIIVPIEAVILVPQ